MNHLPWIYIRHCKKKSYFRRQLLLSFRCVKSKFSLAIKLKFLTFCSSLEKEFKKTRTLPYTPTPLSAASSTNDSMLHNFPHYQHANRFYNEAPEEVREANMPTTVGILPLTLRVGNAIATYKLNKIESPHPNSDQVFSHMEKYCALDALWYPPWLKLSLCCEIFREVMYGVIKASLEMPERANFMLTMTRILALPDEANGS